MRLSVVVSGGVLVVAGGGLRGLGVADALVIEEAVERERDEDEASDGAAHTDGSVEADEPGEAHHEERDARPGEAYEESNVHGRCLPAG